MKKCLLTGAAGFVGSHLLDRILEDTDWNVVCLDRLDHAGSLERLAALPSFARYRSRVEVVYHDLRAEVSRSAAQNILTGRYSFGSEPFDHILHLAAGSHVDRSVLDPAGFVLDNVLGTAHLLDYARGHARHTLIFSTDEVFGPAEHGQCFAESARMNPNNPYAATKAGAELLAPAYANTYGMKITVTRCANVFGERQDAEKFIPLCIRRVLAGEVVQIHARTDGSVDGYVSSRLYTHHRNVTSAVLHVLERGDTIRGEDAASGRYNIEGGEEHNNYEVALRIAELVGKPLRYEFVVDPPGRPRPDMRYSIDSSRLRSLGWEPEIDFAAGLERTVLAEMDDLSRRVA